MKGGTISLRSGDPEPKLKHKRRQKNAKRAGKGIETSQLEMSGSPVSDLYELRHPHVSNEKYAQLALECYEKKHGTEHATYRIVRSVGAFRVLATLPGFEDMGGVLDWCHVSFIVTDSRDEAELLFFAELVDFGHGDSLGLNDFSISKPDHPEITYGCGFCPSMETYPHRRGSYFAGMWDYKSIDVVSQEQLAITFRDKVRSIQRRNMNPGFKPRLGYLNIKPDVEQPDRSCFSPDLPEDEYAKLALSYISELEGVEYELESVLFANAMLVLLEKYGLWCHVVCTAKPKNTDEPSITFFAELHDPGKRKFELNIYDVFDPKNPRNRKGCFFCRRREWVHPRTEDLNYSAGTLPTICYDDDDDDY